MTKRCLIQEMRAQGSRLWLAGGMLLVLLLIPRHSGAQSSIALDRYEPAPVGQTGFASVEPHVLGHLRPTIGASFSYARRPLTLVSQDDTVGLVVDHQLLAHLGASLALFERVELDVDAPATLSQSGDSPSAGSLELASPNGASFNDIRLGARVAVLSQPSSPIAAAIGLRVWVPSGDTESLSGAGELRYEPYVSVGGRHERLRWATHVGRKRQPEGSGLQRGTGSEVTLGAGVWWVEERWSAGPELMFASAANGQTEAFSRAGTQLEALAGAKFQLLTDVELGAAAGPGLTRGIGTPQYRAVISFVWAPGRAAAEAARISGEHEPASGEPAPVSPPHNVALAPANHDRDFDGVLDPEDICPDLPGERAPRGKKPGCPPDRDQDLFFDLDDACPDTPGVASLEPEQHGCPPDVDSDSIPDQLDACPEEAGPKHSDPKLNGCPPSVRVLGKQIVILEQVRFATGSHIILAESNSLLKQVADVLNAHPEIIRVAIDGHTDNVGQLLKNLALSRQRAASVLKHLVAQGVDERRLEARGFGPRRPIAPNTTPEGRAQNRRVEFQILKRSTEGERAWRDGGVQEPGPPSPPSKAGE